MVLYKCPCGYETNRKYSMERHITRKKCINLSIISIDSLNSEPKREDWSSLTEEEKAEKKKEYRLNRSSLGSMSDDRFARYTLNKLKLYSKRRGHEPPNWSVEKVLEILKANAVYKVETHNGILEFPMMLTNGYFNSASVDRIDNNIGYIEGNYELRPHFLNNLYKITGEDIKNIIIMREQSLSDEELLEIVEILKDRSLKNTNFFYNMASSAKKHSTDKKTFDFKTIEECSNFLVEKYIEQGGRCAYTNIPIYPVINHKYKASIERKNPLESYNKDNIILITVELNGQPAGQCKNEDISEEQRQLSLEAGIFNQIYWDECTKFTKETRLICDQIREISSTFLKNNLA
jgi:hypothetical protein